MFLIWNRWFSWNQWTNSINISINKLFIYFTAEKGGKQNKSHKIYKLLNFAPNMLQDCSKIVTFLKRIKQVLLSCSHWSQSADFTCKTYKKGSEYSFLSEYFIYFTLMWNLLEVLQIFASKQMFWSKYSPVWKIWSENFLWSKYSLQHVIDLHQIEYLYANLCKYKVIDTNKWYLRIYWNMQIWNE